MTDTKPAGEQEYTFVDAPAPQATPQAEQATTQATEQVGQQDTQQAEQVTPQATAQAAEPKPPAWDELALKNRAKELIRTKAIVEVTQKQLWAQSGHDWVKFVELLEQEPDPIF